jgi:hypothetical protein
MLSLANKQPLAFTETEADALDDKGRSGAVIAVIYGVRISKSSLGASQTANTCSRVARFV